MVCAPETHMGSLRLSFLMVTLCLAACGAPPTGPAVSRQDVVTECQSDAECPAGMACEGCAGTPTTRCVPGCHDDSQCSADQICNHAVLCTTCPCATGWCDRNPCLDVDRDGYVQSKDPTVTCPGKKLGDCNDANPYQHPGAVEQCGNFIDDDCDGRADPSTLCQVCSPRQERCSVSFDCENSSGQCVQGCCEVCPALRPVHCGEGQCETEGSIDATTGCPGQPVCRPCGSCADTSDPVCGANFTTYLNACRAEAAGTTVLHRGRCLPREGETCALRALSCPSGMSCRASDRRCTTPGTCTTDADCPNGITSTPFCSDGGVAPFFCQNHLCKVRCD